MEGTQADLVLTPVGRNHGTFLPNQPHGQEREGGGGNRAAAEIRKLLKTAGLQTNLSVITLDANGLNIPMERLR